MAANYCNIVNAHFLISYSHKTTSRNVFPFGKISFHFQNPISIMDPSPISGRTVFHGIVK